MAIILDIVHDLQFFQTQHSRNWIHFHHQAQGREDCFQLGPLDTASPVNGTTSLCWVKLSRKLSSIRLADRNRSTSINILFEKNEDDGQFKHNSHIYCNTPLSEHLDWSSLWFQGRQDIKSHFGRHQGHLSKPRLCGFWLGCRCSNRRREGVWYCWRFCQCELVTWGILQVANAICACAPIHATYHASLRY